MCGKVAFVANTGFALYCFRLNLMNYLVQQGREVIALANDESDFTAKFRSHGIEFIDTVIDHKGLNPFSDILFMVRLARIYKIKKPDIVHHFTIKPVIYGSLAAKLAQVPSIVNTITGLGYSFGRGGWLQRSVKLLYRIALAGSPRTIFQNNDDHRLFLANRLVSQQNSSVILGSGINTGEICPSKQPVKDNSKVVFVLIARMLWSKGVYEFVKAAENVKKRYANCEFTMAGSFSGAGAAGNPEMVPLDWLHEVNRKGIVNWVGRLPYEEVLELLDKASVVVLPSFHEGVPKSLIEAASKAKPIITTDAPGCREVVANGLNGFLVPVKDSSKLADCMLKFIEHPQLIPAMGAVSRKRAVAIFDEKIVFEKTMEVYRTACGG